MAGLGSKALVIFSLGLVTTSIASPAEENQCFRALGMRNLQIPNSWITVSSIATEVTKDMLRYGKYPGQPWCPAPGWREIQSAYVQVIFPYKVKLTGVYVQGYSNIDSVSSYTVNYLHMDQYWSVIGRNGQATTFPPFTSVRFSGVNTHGVRIVPKTSRRRPCMKIEIYGCKTEGAKYSSLRPTTTSTTKRTTPTRPTTTRLTTTRPTTTTSIPTTTTTKMPTTRTTTKPTTTTTRSTLSTRRSTQPSRCTGYPELRRPVLQAGVDNNDVTYISCQTDLTGVTNAQLLVKWFVNTREVRSQWLSKGTFGSRLDVTTDFRQWKAGDVFACSISGRFLLPTCNGPTSSQYYSDPLKTEIKVTTPDNIIVEEGGDSKDVEIEVTAPPLFFCKTKFEIDKCTLQFDVSIQQTRREWTCRKRTIISQAVIGWVGNPKDAFCGVVISEKTYQRIVKIPIRAKIDFKYDRNQERVVWIELAHKVAGKVTKITKIKEITVAIIDRDRRAQCRSVNDPHLTTFDGRRYDNMLTGEFYIYKHKLLPFQIHGFYSKCGWRGSCNCGVGIKSGDDVILLSRCPRPRPPQKPGGNGLFDWIWEYQKMKVKGKLAYKVLGKTGLKWALITGSPKRKPPLELQLFRNGHLTPGTRIFSFNKGNKYEIHLPTGLYVTVSVQGSTHINIWVNPSPIDFKQSEGLCGYYDGNQRNDFMMPDGSIHNPTGWKEKNRPNRFNNAWRVPVWDSIFNGCRPGRGYTRRHTTYCNCLRAYKGECGQRFDVETCDIANGGADITKVLEDAAVTPAFSKSNRGKRQTDTELQPIGMPFEFDKNYDPPITTWPTPSGNWTLPKARTFCENYIMKTKATENCQQGLLSNYRPEVEGCIADIQVSDGTDWADSSLESVKEQCHSEMTRFNLSPNATKETAMPGIDKVSVSEIEKTMCPNDCGGKLRGVCNEGTCKCYGSYAGSDCSLSKSMTPDVTRLAQDGLCNQRQTNCKTAIVYGDKFVDSKELSCHSEEVTIDIDQVYSKDKFDVMPATFISTEQIVCPLPTDTRSYLIRVSNDGNKQSSGRLLHIAYDTFCFNCMVDPTAGTSVCIRVNENTTCIIEEKCYDDNETKQEDPCKFCHPAMPDHWTINQSKKCIGKQIKRSNTVAIAVGVTLPLVILITVVTVLVLCCCCKKKKTVPGNVGTHAQHNNNAYVPTIDAVPTAAKQNKA